MTLHQATRSPLRSWPRRAAVTALLGIVAGLAPAQAAQAVDLGWPAIMLGSACTSQTQPFPFWGQALSNVPQPDPTPRSSFAGTVQLCWQKFKLQDKDDWADYYAMNVTSLWTYPQSSGPKSPMRQEISSSEPTLHDAKGATESLIERTDCTVPITVGLGVDAGISFGAETEIQKCWDTTVNRTSLTSTGASWECSNAAQLRKVETVFVQKVAEKSIPHFSVKLSFPQWKFDKVPSEPSLYYHPSLQPNLQTITIHNAGEGDGGGLATASLPRQVHETNGLSTGWSGGLVNLRTATDVSAVMDGSLRRIYSVQQGWLREFNGLSTGWSDGWIPTSGPVSTLSAVMGNGLRRIYTVQSGKLYETSGLSTGWSEGHIPTSGYVSDVSAVMDNGMRRIYTVQSGKLYETNGLSTGWSEAHIPTSGNVTAVSAVMDNGMRRIYTVQNGQLHEYAGLSTGWKDGIIPTNGLVQEVSAVMINGVRRLYTIQNGQLREVTGLSTGWVDNALPGTAYRTAVSAVSDGGLRRVYTVE